MSGQPNPLITTADELCEWQLWLGEEGGPTAAIIDSHNRPRLMCESEDGILYATSPYSEEDEGFWVPAAMELWAYGPFTVIHPASAS